MKSQVYELNEKQIPLFVEMKEYGIRNQSKIIWQIVKFIRKQHGYNPETCHCERRSVVGVSGGIDSALVASLAVKALGKDNVFLVKMPCEGVSSEKSVEYADLLVKKMKVKNIFEVPIGVPLDGIMSALQKGGFEPIPYVAGNAMARLRMTVLYAIASMVGGMVLDTCNLVEILFGYFTKFGDGASDLNPVGGLLKTWVWDISRELGVPEEIINRKPSAELLGEEQTDEEDMGISYEAADLFVYEKYMKGRSDKELVSLCFFPVEVVEMMNKMVSDSAHKREKTPICEL